MIIEMSASRDVQDAVGDPEDFQAARPPTPEHLNAAHRIPDS